MKCLYEVLGVEHDVEESGLKKAYRLLALQWHPDKNQDNLEAAEECFKEIQNAYEILSDPHERAWYDSHRESIMRSGERYQAGGGGFEGGQRPEDEEDLYQFFTSAAFSGFGDGLRGFYGVYNSLFERLAKVEAKAHEQRSDCKGKRAPGPFPRFGFSDAAWPEVTAFYATWGGFATVKDFAWADLYHTASAPNRRVRRAMEGENDKARRAAKREYNEAVRELVAFLRKRDRRVVAHQVEEAKRREQRQAEEAARREAERQERLARAAAYQEAAWVRGEGGSEGSEEDLAEEEQLVWYCVACTKHFKSDAALDNHERSKKHLQQAELLRQVLEEEEAELGGAAAAPDNEDTGSNRAAGKPTQGSSSSSNDGSSSGGGSNLSEVEEEEGEAEGGLRGASGCSSSKSSYAILCGGNRAQPGCGGAAVLAAAAAASTPGQQRDQQKQAAAAAHAQPGSLSDSKSSEEDESGSELDEDGMLMRLVAAHRPQRQAAGSSGSNGTSGSNEESDTSASDDEASGESGSEDRAGQVDEEEDEAALLQRMTPSQPGPGRWQQPQQQPKADEEAVAEGLVAAQLVEGAAEAGRGRDSDWDRKLGKQRGRGGKQQPQQQWKAVTVGQQQHLQPDSEQSQPPPQQPKGGKLSAKEKRWQRHAAATLAAAGSASVQDDMRCSMCQAKFATRNQLFKHLKSEHRS